MVKFGIFVKTHTRVLDGLVRSSGWFVHRPQ